MLLKFNEADETLLRCVVCGKVMTASELREEAIMAEKEAKPDLASLADIARDECRSCTRVVMVSFRGVTRYSEIAG
jgi:hypothetical protein